LYLQEYIDGECSTREAGLFLERAREKSKETLKLDHEELLQHRESCPFLEKGACRVYAARPMACRIYLSYSEASCRDAHRHPENMQHYARLYEFPLLAGRMLNEGFVAYLKQQGLGSSELALEQGYASMRTHGQRFGSWLAS
jgi:Fe-S-cluster containining protein